MTNEKRLSRRREIRRLYTHGWTIPTLVKKYGLCRSYVVQLLRTSGDYSDQEPTIAQMNRWARNNAKIERKALEWRKTHILRCQDFPGGDCCAECHKNPRIRMELRELPHDKQRNAEYAYVCCTKALANWEALGWASYTAAIQAFDSRMKETRC